LVAQPDTGVADHREIDLAIEHRLGVDILAGGGPPTDPLAASMFSPGHGTATSSCVVSGDAGLIVGSAPDAKVVPMRCLNGVVLRSGAAVATAVDRARMGRLPRRQHEPRRSNRISGPQARDPPGG
jgi:hypothetical protein